MSPCREAFWTKVMSTISEVKGRLEGPIQFIMGNFGTGADLTEKNGGLHKDEQGW